MKEKLSVTITRYRIYILMLFGIILGTLYANVMARVDITAISFLQSDYLAAFEEIAVNSVVLWGHVLKIRLKDYVLLMIFGFTAIYRFVFGAYIAFVGMCGGALLSFIVMRYNLVGIAMFVISLLPHYIFYAIALFMQNVTFEHSQMKKTTRFFLIMAALLVLVIGTYTETYFNPVLLKQLYRILY